MEEAKRRQAELTGAAQTAALQEESIERAGRGEQAAQLSLHGISSLQRLLALERQSSSQQPREHADRLVRRVQ